MKMNELGQLFKGIAVLIDDEVLDDAAEISALAKQIEDQNCHVVRMSNLPNDAQLDTMSEAAFFVLDWNLAAGNVKAEDVDQLPLVRVGATLSGSQIKQNIEFLKRIRTRRFAPIFIFTNEDTEEVKAELMKNGLFDDGPTDHIFVQGKKEVLDAGIFEILGNWIKAHPSAYVLKKWEAEYAATRNAFFVDFYSLSHLWPVVLWHTYSADSVSEVAELTAMISRNIVSRLAPVQFDPAIVAPSKDHDALNEQVKPADVRKVLEGERFIRSDRLQADVSVGDVFKDDGKYYVNIRPECDCIAREGEGADEIQIYLIRGSKVTDRRFHNTFNADFGNFSDRDTTSTIFALYDGTTVCFQFQDFKIAKWGDWKAKRIGRLIPPYSTKLQQRFAAFIQRVGLARIPIHAVPKKEDGGDVQAISAQPSSVEPDELSALGHLRAFFQKAFSHMLHRARA